MSNNSLFVTQTEEFSKDLWLFRYMQNQTLRKDWLIARLMQVPLLIPTHLNSDLTEVFNNLDLK